MRVLCRVSRSKRALLCAMTAHRPLPGRRASALFGAMHCEDASLCPDVDQSVSQGGPGMRPSRNKRPPVAADGSLLVVPQRRKRVRRSESDRDTGSPVVVIEPHGAGASYSAGPSRKGTPANAAQDDWDIEFEDAPPALSPDKPQKSTATRANTVAKQTIDSPLKNLPLSTREHFLPQARRAILSVLSGQLPPPARDESGKFDGSECIGLEEQWRSLYSTIWGTLDGEGNSALLVGAPGTGKHMLLNSVLRSIRTTEKAFHLVHLDAASQHTDRLSLRELARQLVRAGAIRLPKPGEEGGLGLDLEGVNAAEEDEEADDFAGPAPDPAEEDEEDEAVALQNAVLSSLANTTSTILTLLSSDQAASRSNLPLIIVLSSFDLYTSRPRQALLYVLLDAVQAGSYTPGLCVLGTTSRLDTTDLLEKRVRSRFSGRTINVWSGIAWTDVLQRILALGLSGEDSDVGRAFDLAWREEAERISKDKAVIDAVLAWESMGNDIRSLHRILFPVVASLSPASPSMHAALLDHIQHANARGSTTLDELTATEFALLIAAKQLLGKDREVFNFAMCFDELRRFVSRIERDRMGAGTASGEIRRRNEDEGVVSSPSKPRGMASQVNVSWSGLLNRRRVMMAFRTLLSLELFQPEIILNSLSLTGTASGAAVSAPRRAAQTAKTDFVRVKCTLFPHTIVEAAKSKNRVEPLNVHLVQWATSHS